MTVAELIARLSTMRGDMPVEISIDSLGHMLSDADSDVAVRTLRDGTEYCSIGEAE